MIPPDRNVLLYAVVAKAWLEHVVKWLESFRQAPSVVPRNPYFLRLPELLVEFPF